MPAAWNDPDADRQVGLLQELIVAARNVRAELKTDQTRRVAAEVSSSDAAVRTTFEGNRDIVLRLATLSELRLVTQPVDAAGGTIRATARFELRIAHGDAVDVLRRNGAAAQGEGTPRTRHPSRSTIAWPTRISAAARRPAEVVRQMETALAERRGELDKVTERLVQLAKSDGASATT